MENILLAIQAALEAGKEIIKIYDAKDFQIEIKNDNSPLTKADKSAHIKIVEYLKKTKIPILSEEGKEIPYSERKSWKKLWIVDPLDGTKEFIKRNGEFTVNIALIENNIPVMGVIYVPVLDCLYLGIIGKGAFKFENPLLLSTSNISFDEFLNNAQKLPIKTNTTFTVVASKSHLSKETEDYIESLRTSYPNLDFISKGSSLKLCAVAEGSADIYPRFAPTMEWDTAAGQAIVEAMGGKVTQTNGEKLSYNREILLNPWFIAFTV